MFSIQPNTTFSKSLLQSNYGPFAFHNSRKLVFAMHTWLNTLTRQRKDG